MKPRCFSLVCEECVGELTTLLVRILRLTWCSPQQKDKNLLDFGSNLKKKSYLGKKDRKGGGGVRAPSLETSPQFQVKGHPAKTVPQVKLSVHNRGTTPHSHLHPPFCNRPHYRYAAPQRLNT